MEVSFLPPLRPQGNITMYTITRSSPPRTFTFDLDTLPEAEPDGSYLLVDSNLRPFTNYTYQLTVCTGGGCTVSDSASEITLEDTPTGVATPTGMVVGPGSLAVEWAEPSMPNGVVQRYSLFRLPLGFENDTGRFTTTNCCEAFVLNVTTPTDDSRCSMVTTTATQTSHLDVNLDPFSYYRYCVVATNDAGEGFSDLSTPIRTSPAPMPLIGPMLNASTLSSTAILLEWSALDISELLGPLQGYTLYGKIAGTLGLGEVLFRGAVEEGEEFYRATELLASTEYVFVVEVSNGVGSARSNNASAVTEEGGESFCGFHTLNHTFTHLILPPFSFTSSSPSSSSSSSSPSSSS